MQKLLFPVLLAFGVGLSGIVTASAPISPGVTNSAASKASPRLRLAAKACREDCDQNGDNCHQRCR